MSKQIPLTQGKFAIVDDADFERVNQFKWCAKKGGNTFYAARHSAMPFSKTIRLHIYLMDSPKGAKVDHKDGNGLNCQRYNLRFATKSQNAMNRGKNRNNKSGFKGVAWHKSRGKFVAQIAVNGRDIHLGCFQTAEAAARAYDEAAKKHHGEFAYLNFP